MRTRYLVFAAVVAVAGCSDSPITTDASNGASLAIAPPSGALETNIYSLFALYPNGVSTAGLNRWTTVKRANESGKQAQARDQLVKLADWVTDMAPRMSDPPGDETRSAAAARLVLYMATYIYDGPAAVPAPSGGPDNAFGIVTPQDGGLIVTPSTNAGVSIPAGAVDVPTLVVITENVTPYPANCSGPLPTKLCQYPKFYHFSQFPHVRLHQPAKFAVCHVNHGSQRLPLADHDRFRLAHNKPVNPADNTPGSTIVDGIEILPLTTQTFSLCDHIHYALQEPTGLNAVLARATAAITDFLTPKSAYAIDQGGGGMGVMMSDFNNVDPDGVPDDSVAAIFPFVNTSGDLSVAFTIHNVGTATSPSVLANFTLTPFATTTAPPPIPWTAAGIVSLAPGDSTIAMTITAPVSSFPSGTYTVTLDLSSNPAFPDANMANNVRTATVTLGPIILKKGKR